MSNFSMAGMFTNETLPSGNRAPLGPGSQTGNFFSPSANTGMFSAFPVTVLQEMRALREQSGQIL